MFFSYKEHSFYAVPTSCNRLDTEFKIYNEDGDFIGTNISGINIAFLNIAEDEKRQIEDQIVYETIKLDARMKFAKEFKIPVQEYYKIPMTIDEIAIIMDQKWSIPKSIMKEILIPYSYH